VHRDQGQATIEWVGLVLLGSLALGFLVSLGPRVDGRAFGGFLSHRIVCAVKGGCGDSRAALAAAYGERGAAVVREHAPSLVYEPGERQLPVDYRRCRRPECAGAPDDPDADVHRSDAGERATVFTRVIRRGGRVYVQYWLYYPDSNTAWAGSDKIWEHSLLLPLLGRVLGGSPDYPGFHRDDWESYHVRIDPEGEVWARSSSHGHYQGCKQLACRNRWIGGTGWTRVSRGSHAGHLPVERVPSPPLVGRGLPPTPRRSRYRPVLPGRDVRERTTTAEGVRLIPLETHDKSGYRALDEEVEPPWRKQVYGDPESDSS
jgi:hypothetical protein